MVKTLGIHVARRLAAGAFLLMGTLVAAGWLVACGDGDDPAQAGENGKSEAVRVAVRTPEVQDAVQLLRANGDIIADRQITLYSAVSGRIVELPVRLGTRVKKDQVIAVVDHSQLDFAVRQARSALAAAREQAENLAVELARVERLYRERGTSKQQYDTIRTQKRTADETVNQAETRLAQAIDQREEADIRAPFDGVIGRRYLEVGDMAGPGVPVAVVVDLTPLLAKVQVPERDLGSLSEGQPGTVQVAGYGGERFHGKVRRISPIIDPATRMAEVELLLPNADHRLRPGMFASVEIEIGRHEDVLVLPSSAVQQESRIREEDLSGNVRRVYFVYVAEADTARRTDVQLGYTTGDLVEISQGLGATDRVVIRGQEMLRDGQKIEVAANSEEYSR